MEKTIEQILEIDTKRHYPEGTDVGQVFAAFNDHVRNGAQVIRQGDTLIAFRAIAPKVIEHHSFNADTTNNVVDFHKKFWRMLEKAGASMATTTYDNPKINDLINSVKNEFDVSIIKNQDGSFTSEVRF
jgi:uncharacterized protein YheU (UPF0270 family)